MTRSYYSYRRLSVFLCFCIALSTVFVAGDVRANNNVYKNKYAAFVMDADTGLILHRENENKALHPASLTKMMTLLMVFEALERGKLDLDDRVVISKHAAGMVPSKLDLPVGSTIKVEDAIFALVTKSANDVAVALAEKLGKTEANFANMMTNKAQNIGMTRTRFMNASGLHHPRQVSSARDMARLARVILSDYSKYYHYFSMQSFTYHGKVYKTHNRLMQSYEGMDGFKTGYIYASGFNLVSSAVRNNRRLIGVVFGGRNGNSRNKQMARLLDESFNKINATMIAQASIPVPQKKPGTEVIEVASADLMPEIESQAGTPDIAPDVFYGSRWDMLADGDGRSMFNRLIGEGDYDIAVRKRIETGLIAVSAHMNEEIPASVWTSEGVVATAEPAVFDSGRGEWAVQIGAFTSRSRTESAILQSISLLPEALRYGTSAVAPMHTREGWIFRGRLHGYSKQAAYTACKALDDCIPVAPTNILNK